MALRAVNFARPGQDPAKQTHLFPSLLHPFVGSRLSRCRGFVRDTRERGNFREGRRRLKKKTRPSSIFLDSSGNRHRGHRSTPPPGPGCWTISSPLKLNSRSIRPLGRFCSNGSEINASFECSPAPPSIVSAFFLRLSAGQVRGRVSSRPTRWIDNCPRIYEPIVSAICESGIRFGAH